MSLWIFLSIPIFALFTFIIQRQHILMCLLSLEMALLSLAFIIGSSYSSLNMMMAFMCIMILTLGACEAALALAVLVNVTRTTGSDMIKSANMSKC